MKCSWIIYSTSISVDPTGTFVAVSNLDDGFDIHRIKTGALVSTIPHDFGDAYPIPVLYIHGGYGIVGGSTLGHASIWYVDEESPVKQQTLDVPGTYPEHILYAALTNCRRYECTCNRGALSLPVTSCYRAADLIVQAHYDEQADQFRIATGLADADNPVVVVWTAQEPKGMLDFSVSQVIR